MGRLALHVRQPSIGITMKRPKRVTLVCWLIIVYSVLTVVVLLFTVFSEDTFAIYRDLLEEISYFGLVNLPAEVQLVLVFVGSIVSVLSAIFMLKAKNWARVLFLDMVDVRDHMGLRRIWSVASVVFKRSNVFGRTLRPPLPEVVQLFSF